MRKRWASSLGLISVLLSGLSLSIVQASAQSGGFSIAETSSFIDESGHYHVVGEVRNDGYSSRIHIVITALFYDKNYVVVGTSRNQHMEDEILDIGETSSFEIVYSDSEKAFAIAGYSLQTIAGRAYGPGHPKPTVQTSTGIYDEFHQAHPGIESMALTKVQFNGVEGGVYDPKNGNWSSVMVHVLLESTDNEVLNYTLIMEVRNEFGITEFVHTEPGSIEPYYGFSQRHYWLPEQAGNYEVRFTVVSAPDNHELLAPVLVEHVTIAG
ncbi:MAG TPA: hypothetical protein VJP79_11265 [Nitrososphaera sp.]|nr:hypothetical protein [Nitrososphaera sp.]